MICTQLHNQDIISHDTPPSPSFYPKYTNNPYLTLLSAFHTGLLSQHTCAARCHSLHWDNRPPVAVLPRYLAPDRHCAAKHKFEHMLRLGIIRLSSSVCSSLLHVVSKKISGDWRRRPCGDYHALINLPFQIDTYYHTSMISSPYYKVRPSSRCTGRGMCLPPNPSWPRWCTLVSIYKYTWCI